MLANVKILRYNRKIVDKFLLAIYFYHVMPKEILLYDNINPYSASEFMSAMGENDINDNIVIRICGGGGDPVYAFGMIAKIQEHTGKKLIKVDGEAHSAYAFMLCYVDESEALEVAEFLIHRAAYPDWYENNPEYFTDDVRANVERVNAFLRKAFEAKVDTAKFEEITGVKIKDIFSLDGRLEVTLTAADAKRIGLIDRVVKITPQKSAEIKTLKAELMAKNLKVKMAAEHEIPKTKNMTKEEFKAAHGAEYKRIIAAGVNKERKRVSALMVYIKVDPKAVAEAIKSGAELDAEMTAEFMVKMSAQSTLSAKKGENGEVIETEEVDANKTAEKKLEVDFAASVKSQLKLK